MRIRVVAFAVIVATFALLACAPQYAQSQSLTGKWEGSVMDPRRPYFMTAEFKPGASAAEWTGAMSAVGNVDAPLQDISLAGSKVSFKLQLRQGVPVFEGELKGDEISGKVTFRAGPTDFRLTRLPAAAEPKDRVESWQQDIDTALRFTRYDRSFTPAAREEYRKRLESLKARIASLNDYQIVVELAKAIALGNNAHTNMNMGRSTLARSPFPLRVAWFKDGLFVTRTAPQYADAIGCRVTAVNGRPVAQVKEVVTQLFAGNDSWDLSRSTGTLIRPEYLHGLGITKELHSATYSLECAAGKRDLQLTTPDSAPATPPNDRDFSGVWKTDAERPRYLRNRDKNYWFEYLPDLQILYFQFNSSLNGGDETIPQFGERLLKELEEKPARAVVVDMRFNGGGNLDIAESFIEKLRTAPKLQTKNKLFVITGTSTFSAAIFHAARLRANADAVFVGEPVGDHLEFWAEGDAHTLPNSKVVLRSSNGYHSYSRLDPPQLKPYYRDLSITSLGPDIPAQATFKDYAAGRDVAMVAIMARLK